MDEQIISSPNIMAQCRICHDEDEDENMDTPCSCNGTLKYAHENCVQRWCNEKGDTTCEICQQQLTGYISRPSPLQFHYGGSPINFGENWEISGWDVQNHQFITWFPANYDQFLDLDDFEFSALSTTNLICCRIVAIIIIALLVLRHTLPIIFVLSGATEYTMKVLMLIMLRIIGSIVPVYLMIKAIVAIQRLQYQDQQYSPTQSNEENDMLRIIHIQ